MTDDRLRVAFSESTRAKECSDKTPSCDAVHKQRKAGHRHDRHGTLSDIKLSSESCQCRSLSYCHSPSGTWLTTDDRAFLGKSCHQPIALQSSQCQLRLRCRLLRFPPVLGSAPQPLAFLLRHHRSGRNNYIIDCQNVEFCNAFGAINSAGIHASNVCVEVRQSVD